MMNKEDERFILALRAGARAILTNKRLEGSTYVHDVFGEPKHISYHEAATLLLEAAESLPMPPVSRPE